jgi:hypothetical protein
MQTEKEYQQATNQRLDLMGYSKQQKATIQMLLYWSYVEGGRDADKDILKRIEDERTSQKDYK